MARNSPVIITFGEGIVFVLARQFFTFRFEQRSYFTSNHVEEMVGARKHAFHSNSR